MRADAELIGRISLYRLLPGPLTEPADAASVLADAVAAMLQDPLASTMFSGPIKEGGRSSRALVQQAAGMLMSQLEISADDGLAIDHRRGGDPAAYMSRCRRVWSRSSFSRISATVRALIGSVARHTAS